MAISTVIHTNRHSIDRVLNAGLPVLLLFWDSNKRPTADVEAILEAAAARDAGKLLIARVDAQEEGDLARRFGVGALPALEVVAPTTAANTTPWIAYLAEGGTRPAPAKRPQPQTQQTDSTQGSGQPLVLTDATFDRTVNAPGPVLVDFWAPWCGPCRMVGPSVERLAREYAGRAVVAKLNVDENQATSQRFGVQGIPTLLIFKGGKVVDQIVGAQPYDALNQRLARHMN
jgi:thioredoxin 1